MTLFDSWEAELLRRAIPALNLPALPGDCSEGELFARAEIVGFIDYPRGLRTWNLGVENV